VVRSAPEYQKTPPLAIFISVYIYNFSISFDLFLGVCEQSTMQFNDLYRLASLMIPYYYQDLKEKRVSSLVLLGRPVSRLCPAIVLLQDCLLIFPA
jgi:hypothetical protein